jgi:cell volume regulation protein A
LNQLFIGVGVLLSCSVMASKISGRTGLPLLLAFMAIGMLAGSDGPGGVPFADYAAARNIGVIALVFILFSGGLETRFSTMRTVIKSGISLSTVGVLVSTAAVGLFGYYALGLDWAQGMLLGALVSSTDAAAVFSVLRGRSIHLKPRLAPLLELESGCNDPMAVFLTISMITLIQTPGMGVMPLIGHFVWQMALGVALGFAFGWGTVQLINRLKLDFEGLYPVLTMAVVLLTYGLCEALGGNGFLAVYVAGAVMGSQNFLHRRSLIIFHDGLAWLVQIGMFIVLGLLVFPRQLPAVAVNGIGLSVYLLLFARPLSVFIALANSRFTVREKLFISWVGLRGAVPIVLATYPLLAGAPLAHIFFNLVFFVVIASVLFQGTTIPLVARALGVNSNEAAPIHYPIEVNDSGSLRESLTEVVVEGGSAADSKSLVELGLPEGALVVLMYRGGALQVPRGRTQLMAGDRLLLFSDAGGLAALRPMCRKEPL